MVQNAKVNLYEASNQWANRPDDERFWTLSDLYEATKKYASTTRTVRIRESELQLHGTDSSNELFFKNAKLTNWGFSQLCQKVNAPMSYLQSLPAPIVANCLNSALEKQDHRDISNLLFQYDGNNSPLLRCLASDSYSRIWNFEIAQRLLDLEQSNWRVPPARPNYFGNKNGNTRIATEQDVLLSNSSGGGLSVEVGDLIAPAGLYASDHDMFVFMINEHNRIDDGSNGGLSRGFFVQNSEVVNGALRVTKFLYRHVCGNHIVWDASEIQSLRLVHKGEANKKFGVMLMAELVKYENSSEQFDVQKIQRAKSLILGKTKEQILDKLFGLKIASRTILSQAYQVAIQQFDSDNPNSAWGFSQGITALSQKTNFMDKRNELDKAASKILALAS